ncbi:MAG: heparinase II/III-family protein, partial [Deltaproteobacteria bacterium]|nr:heparinase II/III-family protein [Deltaproteobacteria bacterium]
RGRIGRPPERLFRSFCDAGIATMRSHYGADANFLAFRAGPIGAFHIHADQISLDVTAVGKPRLVDPGITSYAPDRLTDHYRSALAHNTIVVGRKGLDLARLDFAQRIRPAGEDLCWRSQGPIEVVTGACRGPWEGIEGECAIHRSVIFVRAAYWIVRDMIKGDGEHEVTACWQFFPGRVEMVLETSAAEFVDARGPGMKLMPLLGSAESQSEIAVGLTRPPRGWVSVEGADLPATSLQYTIHTGPEATLIWLIIPFRAKQDSRVKASRFDSDDHCVTLDICFPSGVKDLIRLHPADVWAGDWHPGHPDGRIDYECSENTNAVSNM